RRDVAVLRVVGFTARQVRLTVLSHAGLVAAAGLLVGVPLGLVTGRWLWSNWASSIDVVDTAVTPAPVLASIPASGVSGAVVAAVVPSRRAARIHVAEVLRAE